MAATRAWPDETTHPSDITGGQLATLQKTEGDAVWDRVINQVGTIGGTADNITGVCTPPLTANPTDGQTFRLTPAANNTSASVNINIDSRGNIRLKDCDGNDPVANDIVAGRPITFYRHGASGNYRLTHATQRALIAALASSIAAANTGWEQFGDTTVSSAASQVEHTFAAGSYSKILVVMSGIVIGTGSDLHLRAALRNASAVIVNLPATEVPLLPTDYATVQAEFLIDTVSATKMHYGRLVGAMTSVGALTEIVSSGFSTTAPDRVRVDYVAATIGGGRIMSYGLKV